MASTPMDLDHLESSSPANGTPSTSLHITRTLGSSLPSTSAVTDVISMFRPTKVPIRPAVDPELARPSQLGLRKSTRASRRTHKSAASAKGKRENPALPSQRVVERPLLPPNIEFLQTASDLTTSPPETFESEAVSDKSQLFKREDTKSSGPPSHILSLDYDDPGELLMTSESDETIQIYKVRDGRHDKQLLSKKYGVKLAKFTHVSSSIIYASTKVNDAIRYLTTHDNAFVRYFEGHEASVTCLAMHPGSDDFISCSKDNTVRLWNAGTKHATGVLYLNTPYLSAFDPSGKVFAVASPTSGEILLYDHRNFDKAPFQTFDIVESCIFADPNHVTQGWTKLEFSNDGRSILLGTKGGGHFLLDSFHGTLRAYLRKSDGGTTRIAPGEDVATNGSSNGRSSPFESSGDCCFSPDGRFVISGSRKGGVLIWDTLGEVGENKILDPLHVLEDERQAAVVAFNPRFNFFATADKDLVLWVPDPHA